MMGIYFIFLKIKFKSTCAKFYNDSPAFVCEKSENYLGNLEHCLYVIYPVICLYCVCR